MKIIVHEDRQIRIRAVVPVAIQDISSGLERVTVHLLRFGAVEKSPSSIKPAVKARKQVWGRTFSRVLANTLLTQSLETPSAVTKQVRPKAAKTIEVKITLPSIPKIRSLKDVKQLALDVKGKLVRSSLKTRITMGIAAMLFLWFCYALLPSNPPVPLSPNVDRATGPMLPKGTPTYATVLPAGKSIQSLGGWTRVSPTGRNPVYAYVDKIGNTQVDVSEQPLPAGFQTNTQEQVAQLAKSFNATEKFPAGSTNIYIATLADDSQSVILSKNKLLVLMKSTSLLPPTKWVSYVNSLQ